MRCSICLVVLFLASSLSAVASPEKESAAVDLIRSEEWTKAARAFAEITEENPYKGENFYYLGRALQNLDRCKEALPAYETSIALGMNGRRGGMQAAHVSAAACASIIGNGARAYAHFQHAWKNWGLRDFSQVETEAAFAALRAFPAFQELSGLARPIARDDLTAKARADLNYFVRLVRETHPEPFHAITEEDWMKRVRQFRNSLRRRGPFEIVAGFMELASLIGDGHTAVYPPNEGPAAFSLLPIWPMWLEGSWYVVAADPQYKTMVGGELVRAGSMAFDDVVEDASKMLAVDNEFTKLWLAQIPLQFANVYEIIGATNSPENVDFLLEFPDGERKSISVVVQPIRYDPSAHFAPEHWATIFDSAAAPEYLVNANKTFHVAPVDDQNAVYAQMNNVFNTEEMSIAQFGKDVRAALSKNNARNLILDLRLNNGGNGDFRWDLLHELSAYTPLREGGEIIVLTGPRTYSAAIMLAGDLQSKFNAVFIGLPSGGRPVNYSSETPFTLPNLKLSGSISQRLHVDGLSANDRRPFIRPDIVAWPSAEDLAAGRDPVLEAALDYLARND